MENRAVSSCNCMFSNYYEDSVFLSVFLLAETQKGLPFCVIFILMIQWNNQSIKSMAKRNTLSDENDAAKFILPFY